MNVLEVLDYYNLLVGAKPNNDYSLKVVCPFHAESIPSMTVDLKDGRYYCFGCSASGNMYDLVAKLEEIDALMAIQKIIMIGKKYKGRGEIKIPELAPKDAEELLEMAEYFFLSLSKPSWEYIKTNYMFKRGFKRKTLKYFNVKINQSSNYPIIIPLYEQGEFKGYVCRRIDAEEPKYLYNDGFSKKGTLFGNLKKGPVMVVEGSLDRMKVHQFGFHNVGAMLGWKCSEHQAEIIDRYATKILCATDNDEAGEKGYDTLLSLFPKKTIRFVFPDGVKDPGEMHIEQFWNSFQQTVMHYI